MLATLFGKPKKKDYFFSDVLFDNNFDFFDNIHYSLYNICFYDPLLILCASAKSFHKYRRPASGHCRQPQKKPGHGTHKIATRRKSAASLGCQAALDTDTRVCVCVHIILYHILFLSFVLCLIVWLSVFLFHCHCSLALN